MFLQGLFSGKQLVKLDACFFRARCNSASVGGHLSDIMYSGCLQPGKRELSGNLLSLEKLGKYQRIFTEIGLGQGNWASLAWRDG